MQKGICSITVILCFVSVFLPQAHGAQVYTSDDISGKDKVRLTDITTLTLYAGRQTTGRRSSPVPQLQCVGGSAGCGSQILPSVVQCYNRGHDGADVQWECKADLDNRVKLGAVEVVCEGYDYADDPYILKGSCGLEYQLNVKSNSGGGGGGSTGESSWKATKQRGFMFSDLLILGIAAVIVYALYKTCLTTPQYSSTSSDYPDGRPGNYGGSYPSSPPPPYNSGDYSQGYDGADCHSQRRGYRGGGGGMGSGSFWTGAATGGVLGYLFGQRGQGASYGGGSRHYGYTSDRNTDWGWGSGGGGGGGASSSGTSSSTSFGGTRRR